MMIAMERESQEDQKYCEFCCCFFLKKKHIASFLEPVILSPAHLVVDKIQVQFSVVVELR